LEMDLEQWLQTNNIWHRFVEKPETIHTADASKAAGVELSKLTKNLVTKTDEGEYILVVVPGTAKIDLKKVAKLLGKRNVSLVSFDDAEAISGYPPGATPSLFHKTRMRVIMDQSLASRETFFCGGGTREKILELKPEDIVRFGNAVIADVIKTSG
jgi:Cys-tRNA(Pro)/Cys-tRNA(Cys) deacylase